MNLNGKKLIDLQLPWFIPLWRRIMVVAVCAIWTIVELWVDDIFWALLFGAITAYAIHQFFIAFAPKDPNERN